MGAVLLPPTKGPAQSGPVRGSKWDLVPLTLAPGICARGGDNLGSTSYFCGHPSGLEEVLPHFILTRQPAGLSLALGGEERGLLPWVLTRTLSD